MRGSTCPKPDDDTAGAPSSAFALGDFVPYRLSLLVGRISARFARLLDERHLDIGDAEWRILAIVQDRSPIATRDLMHRTSLDAVQCSRTLIRLEHRGLVERVPSPADRRSHLIGITDRGRTAARAASQLSTEFQEQLLSGLTGEEVRRLLVILGKLEKPAT